jgi:hypothetical protein
MGELILKKVKTIPTYKNISMPKTILIPNLEAALIISIKIITPKEPALNMNGSKLKNIKYKKSITDNLKYTV